MARRIRSAIVGACAIALAATGGALPASASTRFVNVGMPKVVGSEVVGRTLKAIPDTHTTPTASTVTYQWRRNGKKIPGATRTSYRPAKADIGRMISLTVCYNRPGATSRCVTSKPTAKVPELKRLSAGMPKVVGAAAVDLTVRATPGDWTAGTTFSYQWYRDGRAIPGSTAVRRTLTLEDLGHAITVKVTGRKAGHATASRTSPASVVPGVSARQQKAAARAEWHLARDFYSRADLVDLLRTDGYSHTDAGAAVDSLQVGWAHQALGAAQLIVKSGKISRAQLERIIDVDRRFTTSQTQWAMARVKV